MREVVLQQHETIVAPEHPISEKKGRDAEGPALERMACAFSHPFVDRAAADGLAEQPHIELDARRDRRAGLLIYILVADEHRLKHGLAVTSQRALHARGVASPCRQTTSLGQRLRFDEGYAIVFGPGLCVAAAITPLILSRQGRALKGRGTAQIQEFPAAYGLQAERARMRGFDAGYLCERKIRVTAPETEEEFNFLHARPRAPRGGACAAAARLLPRFEIALRASARLLHDLVRVDRAAQLGDAFDARARGSLGPAAVIVAPTSLASRPVSVRLRAPKL